MTGYYLGEQVEIVWWGGTTESPTGWVGARFASDRKRRVVTLWREQVKTTPWGEAVT